LLLAACGTAAPTPAPEAPEPAPVEVQQPAEAPDADEEDEEEVVTDDEDYDGFVYVFDTPEDVVFGALPGVLPRHETLYLTWGQWGTPINSNPFSANSNNGMVVAQEVMSGRILVYETLFMFNKLDGQLYPLLAEGDFAWNDEMTVITVNINQDAHWDDGVQVTAHDVAATFDAHVRVESPIGLEYGPFISQVVATDDFTVEFHTNADNYNPMKVLEYLPRVFVTQQAYIERMFTQYGSDYAAFRDSAWHDAPSTGPYRPALLSSHMIVLERDDNYWGQAPSMWGRLPVPRFIAQNILSTNDARRAAFATGQVDITQIFIANVWDMWERDGLPVSTYLMDPPFFIPGSMPSIWFNTTRPGLDQLAVRQAIAFAIDYDQIISAAMSGYSPRFEEAPRSIAAPLEGEQRFVDNAALADLQWGSRDIARANQILDDAGIIDTTGDGIRDWNGENLSFTLMCPVGWSDWEASLEIVAAAGAEIGIDLSTSFVETAVWTEARFSGDFDIIMDTALPTSVAAPWSRAHHALFVEDPDADRVFWAWHRMYNPEINALILRAAAESDINVLREYYTEISRFLLEQKPLIYLMYRPAMFQTVNESVWTGFPEHGDGTNIPPMMLAQGYGIAGLYNIRLVD